MWTYTVLCAASVCKYVSEYIDSLFGRNAWIWALYPFDVLVAFAKKEVLRESSWSFSFSCSVPFSLCFTALTSIYHPSLILHTVYVSVHRSWFGYICMVPILWCGMNGSYISMNFSKSFPYWFWLLRITFGHKLSLFHSLALSCTFEMIATNGNKWASSRFVVTLKLFESDKCTLVSFSANAVQVICIFINVYTCSHYG